SVPFRGTWLLGVAASGSLRGQSLLVQAKHGFARLKRAHPAVAWAVSFAGVNAGLTTGGFTRFGQRRIDVALQKLVAFAHLLCECFESTFFLQPADLRLRVEDKRREGKAAREAGGTGMDADHEEGLAEKREAEVGVVWVRRIMRVPCIDVVVVQHLQVL